MKRSFLYILLFFSFHLQAQEPAPIVSKSYHWDEAEMTTNDIRMRRYFLKGSTRDLAYLEMHATTLAAGKELHPLHQHDREELLIVKEGKVKVKIENNEQILGPGSVAVVMPGDQHGLENVGEDSATFYILLYQSNSGPNQQRAKEAGGSFMINWEDVPLRETQKGGARSFFERPTAMFERLEMHVTTLKSGIQSHPPHTHRPAEIILMIEGESQEQIDDNFYQGQAGDFYFLGSETLHTIKNIGDQPCTYFAFQFN